MIVPFPCRVCAAYADRRRIVLDPHLRIRAAIRGLSLAAVESEFLHRVHQRHLKGGSLSTRTSTMPTPTPEGMRIVAQRGCNGCGASLGDATDAELDAAAAGLPLPDARLEHGCLRDGADA